MRWCKNFLDANTCFEGNAMKALVIVLNLFGYGGDSINEKQILINLCKHVHKCIIITFVGVSGTFRVWKYRMGIYEEFRRRSLKNTLVLPIPLSHISILILFLSPLITFVAWFLDKIYHFELVYVRESPAAFGLLMFRSLTSKLCVKISSIREDEITRGKAVTKFIYTLTDRLTLLNAKIIGFPTPIMFKNLS
jgi:hypothetical protein